jgi:DNA-binding MarR family transcriptional regulator
MLHGVPMKSVAQDLDRSVNSLRRIVREIRLSSHTAERTLGISGAQLFVLQELSGHAGISLRELAGRTFTHQSSVSVVVSRLVRSRLVTRRTSASDGRRIELSLTPAGQSLLRRAPELAQSRLLGALRRVPPRDLRVVGAALEAIAQAMGTSSKPPGMFFEKER